MPSIGSLKRAAAPLLVALFIPGGSLLVLAALLVRYAGPTWSGGAFGRFCFRTMGIGIWHRGIGI